MRFAVLALIVVGVSAPMAQAGAWLRQEGTGFFSSSVQTTENDGNSTSLYTEYGLRDDVTLGLDVHYDTDLLSYATGTELDIETLDDVPTGSGVIFLRFPLSAPDATDKLAFHVGIGARYFESEILKAAEIGVSWGRGIRVGERTGWVNVDASYNHPEEPALTRVKLDGTVGLGLTETTKLMLQLFNTFVEGEAFTNIAPSVLFTPRARKVTYQIGAEIPIDGRETSLKLGVWFVF